MRRDDYISTPIFISLFLNQRAMQARLQQALLFSPERVVSLVNPQFQDRLFLAPVSFYTFRARYSYLVLRSPKA